MYTLTAGDLSHSTTAWRILQPAVTADAFLRLSPLHLPLVAAAGADQGILAAPPDAETQNAPWLKRRAGVEAVPVCIRSASRRVVWDKKVSLLLHVIIYRYIHTVGHSVNLTYFPRKLQSKRLCSLKAEEKSRMHRLKSLCYERCQKWVQVSPGSLLTEETVKTLFSWVTIP